MENNYAEGYAKTVLSRSLTCSHVGYREITIKPTIFQVGLIFLRR